MLRIGICGFGGLGHVHANSLCQVNNAKVTAVCDINPSQLEAKEVAFNIEQAPNQFEISTCATYLDFSTMLDKEDLDAVVIALPTNLHAEYSIMAMDKGCHVFCEKPMSLNAQQCDEMIAARDRNDRQLQIGQCLRFWPEYEYLLEKIQTKEFGKLHSLVMCRVGQYPSSDPACWYMDHKTSGGALLDLHVHDLDWAQAAFGRPSKIAVMGVVGKTGGVDDLTALYNYPDGPLVTIRCSWMHSKGFSMTFTACFDQATLVYDPASTPTLTLHKTDQEDPVKIETSSESAYLREISYFLECVEGKHNNVKCPAESTRQSIDIAREEERMVLGG